jgi:aminopeptidase N
VVPAHYDLTISPDPERLTFSGTVGVDVEVAAPTALIVLNAKGLTLDSADLDGVPAVTIRLDPALDRAMLTFPATLEPGRHRLSIAYHGPILKGTFGFFAMDYGEGAGRRRTLATNFEPGGARMLLPCWDEPGRKASFSISVDAPHDRVAISNMPTASVERLANGLDRVSFSETPRMSTYLLFLSVGDYERVHADVGGTDVGVVVKQGDGDKAAYALGEASALLAFYNDYFGVRYPLPKLDLVAAPGQISGGSMENWGAIFYSQNHLLIDPPTATDDDRQEVFLVVSHEMAHQWFGDLVTMAWWDNLWLNEGFARWMQTHAADALHPDWRTGLKAQDIFETGKRADAKPSTHPVLQPVVSAEQAAQAFDNITYDKGAAVITMLEAYVGQDLFRAGVRRYMRKHAFGNTVDADLWSEVEAVAGKPILEIERAFTRQAGVPLVRVTPEGTGSALAVSRFTEDPALRQGPLPHWPIPLASAPPQGPAETMILDGAGVLAFKEPLVNAGAMSYVRTAYAPSDVEALARRLKGLAAADQMNLLNDAWALGQAGDASAADLLVYLDRLPAEADPIVWRRAVELLVAVDRAYPDGAPRRAFRALATRLLTPVARRIGAAPRAGEDAAARSLRSDLWRFAARMGDRAALARARATAASASATPEERRTALEIEAAAADPRVFASLEAQARATSDPLAKSRILTALAGTSDPVLAARLTLLALGPEAPAGTAPGLLIHAAAENPDAVWTALEPHLGDPDLPIDANERGTVISAVASFSADPARIGQLTSYAEAHLPADAREAVQEAIAEIRLNLRVRALAVPQIDAYVKARRSLF